jgi:hypothetical protein
MKSFLHILGLLVASVCLANVIRVPEDYETIQLASGFTSHGDTIIVGPGVYSGNGGFGLQDGVNLLSSHGALSTIIDGMNSNGSFISGSNCIIQGFTITRFHPAPPAGALSLNGGCRVVDCIFNSNFAGIAHNIYGASGSIVIVRSVFYECTPSPSIYLCNSKTQT